MSAGIQGRVHILSCDAERFIVRGERMKSEDERRGTVRKMKVAIAVIVSAAGLVTI
jgi:hypothetical protein